MKRNRHSWRPLRPFAACGRESTLYLRGRKLTMATTAKSGPTTTRSRGHGSNHDMDQDEAREQQLDLLTAAIIGAVVGAGITLLFRSGPSGRRPIRPVLELAGRGARMGGLA